MQDSPANQPASLFPARDECRYRLKQCRLSKRHKPSAMRKVSALLLLEVGLQEPDGLGPGLGCGFGRVIRAFLTQERMTCSRID